jgi:hypothetical protein
VPSVSCVTLIVLSLSFFLCPPLLTYSACHTEFKMIRQFAFVFTQKSR